MIYSLLIIILALLLFIYYIYSTLYQLIMIIKKENEDQLENYQRWIVFAKIRRRPQLPPMTSTQAKFAKWLLHPKRMKHLSKIGNLEIIFESVYWFAKSDRNAVAKEEILTSKK